MSAVQTLFRIMAVCLALFWVPLTSHCRIEAATGQPFLHSHDGHEHGHDHQETHASCLIAESCDYKSDLKPVGPLPPAASFLLLSALLQLQAEPPADAAPGLGDAGQPPPELSVTWQFSSRVALAPRAPSSVS
jgi:hypothetical protein